MHYPTLSRCHARTADCDSLAADGDARKQSDANRYRDIHTTNGDSRKQSDADRYRDTFTNSYSHAGTARRIQH